MDSPYLVIARRYRPQVFADVVGQDAVVKTLQNAVRSQRVSHAYLFSGSRGTGKTSIARLYAKLLNCASPLASGEPCNTCPSCVEITEGRSLDVQEIDGASHRGIDHIRSLTESVSYAPTCGRYKIYLIDEVHMLTKEAFNALLKTLEEPPKTVLFFLATTEPHKIPTTILSRCQRCNLRRLSKDAIVSKLRTITHDMKIQADEGALFRLARYADGGLRDAESLLDQAITFSDGHVRESIIEEILGIAPIEWLLELDRAIEASDIATAYQMSDKVFHEGKDIGHFIDDVSDHYRTLLHLRLGLSPKELVIDPDHEPLFKATATLLSQEHLLDVINLLAEAQRTLKTAASQRFLLEWLLLSIIRIRQKVSLPLIAKKLFELQGQCESVQPLQVPKNPETVSQPQKSSEKKPPLTATQTASSPSKRKTSPEIGTTPNTVAEASVTTTQREAGAPLPAEQEKARQENVVLFAASELRATIIQR